MFDIFILAILKNLVLLIARLIGKTNIMLEHMQDNMFSSPSL